MTHTVSELVYAQSPETLGVLQDIADERRLQDATFGVQNHPCIDRRVISPAGYAEMAALIRRFTEQAMTSGTLHWQHILDEEVAETYATTTTEELRAELVQVAAVAVAWIECIDRRETR